MMCPNCGSTYFKESRQCPIYKGEPVCITCCTACEYYRSGCGYYIKNYKRNYEAEIKHLMKKLSDRQVRADNLWRARNIEEAQGIEDEIDAIRKEIRNLKHEEELFDTGSSAPGNDSAIRILRNSAGSRS